MRRNAQLLADTRHIKNCMRWQNLYEGTRELNNHERAFLDVCTLSRVEIRLVLLLGSCPA